ncbi:MAG TPA: OmpA family protein [Desulfobacteraceae bacterium]|nr:OmpA family protein [Desulfobacteraceae bacterium]
MHYLKLCISLFAGVLLFTSISCSTKQELIVLVSEDDGTTGVLSIDDGEKQVVLDRHLSAAGVDSRGRAKKTDVSEKELAQTFALALSAQPEPPAAFRLKFRSDSTRLSPESEGVLVLLFAEVDKRGGICEVEITGHTDRFGPLEYNDQLSLKRAEKIKKLLMERGLRASFIRAVGRGEREPLVKTEDGVREPDNRRVEILVR